MKKDYAASPTRRIKAAGSPTKTIDPKLGAPRKTAGVRNLPKIDKRASKKGSKKGQSPQSREELSKANSEANNDDQVKNDIKPTPLGPVGSSRKASANANNDSNSGLESLAEEAKEE